MKKLTLLIGFLLLAGPVLAQDCDRDCLRGMLTTYLDAMLKHDPALVPTTDNVRFTEDHKDLRLGEGLWASIQGYGTFRQDVLDVRGSTAGTHVLAMENGNPVLVAIRLKIEGGKVSEAETTVVRNREEGMNFGPGSLMRGEGELSVWEMFKIYDGRIQAIEAFMEEVPPGTPFGWTY